MSVLRYNGTFRSTPVGNASLSDDSPATPWVSEIGANVVGVAVMPGAGTSTTTTPITVGTTSLSGTTAVPSWVSGLATASIRADMTAADVNGSVSETGLETLFADVAASLSASNTTLTAAEFADLKTIAANLNNGMTASAYVTYVTNALVNGNAANATWTGGGKQSVALGNLAVGSNATKVSELNGKWFLGSDLPNATVIMSGSSTFSVSYSAEAKPLFAATGPAMGDINQGYLGDCYLLSTLAEVANHNPTAISSMITDNGNNTYGVRFYYDGNAEYVTVSNDLANGGTLFNTGPDLWASLVEQAYVQFQTINLDTGNSVNYGNSWSTIGNGGLPEFTLEAITGASMITDFYANGASWQTASYNSSFGQLSSASGLSTASVISTLKADLTQGYDIVLSSRTNATDSSGRNTLIADHAMSIYGYDASTGNLEIRNPWGSVAYGQYWDTTFEISLATLLADGDTISVANLPGASGGPVSNALVSAAAGLQTSSTVTAFTIADTMANVSAGLSALAADTKLTGITLTDSSTPSLTLTSAQFAADTSVLAKIGSAFNLTVTGALVSAAAGLQTATAVTSFAASDTAANVSAALASLNADSKLTAITLTDASKPTITLTAAQYAAEAQALAKITTSHNLAVTGALASAAANLQAASGVTSFTVSDTAANVSALLPTLATDSKLTAIALTDASKPTFTLTAAQYAADASALAKITTSHTLAVTGELVSAAAGVQSAAAVTTFTVSDTAANVTAALASLSADSKLTAITLTDTSKQTFTLTAAQYVADSAALAKITTSHNLTVTGAAASAAAGLQAAAGVTSFTVADTAANVTAGRLLLNGDKKLSALTISGTTGGDTLNLTGSAATATINLGGDTAKASAGLNAPSLTFIGTPDAITLGTGAATITDVLSASGGIETIANFTYGVDHLVLGLNGAASSMLKAFDTTVNGVHAISLYSSADTSHGVVLLGMPSVDTAANLMASHVVFSGGNATIG